MNNELTILGTIGN